MEKASNALRTAVEEQAEEYIEKLRKNDYDESYVLSYTACSAYALHACLFLHAS